MEFYNTGQEGFTAPNDPRFFLTFLDINGMKNDETHSKVQNCSFHNGFYTAIGIFGSNDIDVDQNVIHHAVGNGKSSFTCIV